MRIPIKYPIDNHTQEWVLLELQGILESNNNDEYLDKHMLGDFSINNKGDPTLTIGNHLLTGKIIQLEKPFALLEKTKESLDDKEDDVTKVKTSYEVVTIIYKKILFKDRPKPIIRFNNNNN
eukprot:TRINITY_DN13055_c0_g1_i1.p1 TRINITY_DN13055_c0_g1~~TRINITY_DN13055_c0_g1_i1.p1  ORF type:complete len:122 (+),score=30.05 TRINITY_DN13055_c0_g1_i1:53-418(+)